MENQGLLVLTRTRLLPPFKGTSFQCNIIVLSSKTQTISHLDITHQNMEKKAKILNSKTRLLKPEITESSIPQTDFHKCLSKCGKLLILPLSWRVTVHIISTLNALRSPIVKKACLT